MDEIEQGQPVEKVRSISPTSISSAIIGAILLIVVVQIGFYKTYLQFFPQFEGFRRVQHFHGAMMMGWLIMLLVQPILIRAGKFELHRLLGRASYLLAPLVAHAFYGEYRIRAGRAGFGQSPDRLHGCFPY